MVMALCLSASVAHAATGGAVAGKQPPPGPLVSSPSAAPRARAVPADSAILPGFEAFTLPGNDDGSSAEIKLPFPVKLFTRTYKALYINNNGNVTFGEATAQYTPEPLWTFKTPMIAPFWADVDTRVGNVVTYGTSTIDGHQAFGVTWPGVGCYSEIDSVTNTFQLVLIDRSDVGKGDFDIQFNYGPIEWESGQASGGDASCLNGTAAAAGYTSGTGLSYELPGSGTNGALLSSNPVTGLSNQSYGSSSAGTDIFPVRGGQPTPAALPARYVALGDSYSAGEGNPGSDPTPWVDTSGNPTTNDNGCDRSAVAYPMLVATWLKSQKSLPAMSLRFLACSGARTEDLWDSGAHTVYGLSGATDTEPQQLLDTSDLAAARVVTVTVGGNDLNFADVLTNCTTGPPLHYCNASSNDGWIADLSQNIFTLEPILRETYLQIEAEAPNAALYVIGYPDLLPPNASLAHQIACSLATGITEEGINYLIGNEVLLDEAVSQAASEAGAHFVDPNFKGSHGFLGHDVCALGHWFNELNLVDPQYSYHPNKSGQAALAADIKAAIESNSSVSG